MGKKIVSGTLLTLLLIGMFTLASNVQPAKASGTIYIKADGSVDPDTAPISTVDNVTYTFTDDIYDGIWVERSNIIIDGNGYTLQGSGSGSGFFLRNVNNVTIKKTKIKEFGWGIQLWYSCYNTISENDITQNSECGIWLAEHSHKNTISGNNITKNTLFGIQLLGLWPPGSWPRYNTISDNSITYNGHGIWLYRGSTHNSIVGNSITNNGDGIKLPPEGFYNTISGNNITQNQYGIRLSLDSYDNTISGNSITYNGYGIWLDLHCGANTISGNSITYNGYGIYLFHSSGNKIYHNNFIGNTPQASVTVGYTNIWDDGYPSGGNYWSDYIAKGGYDADGDGIGDIPYTIDAYNKDRYPLMNPWDTIPPVANAGPDQTVYEDTLVTFDASGSSDNIGITSYVWTFIDVTPQTLTGVSPTYTFQTPGIYTVTLNVADAAGNWATDTVTITVLPDVTSPVADAGPDQTVDEDTLVTLEGWRSTDNVGITGWTWTFTDVTPQTLTGENVTYTFATPGTYTITLNVSDAAGNWDADTVIITVLDVTSPVADAGPYQTVNEDTEVAFDGSGSTDNVGIVSYVWNFGDGTTGTGVTATHTYTEPGTYTVTLNVTDAGSNWDTDDVVIAVVDVTSPVADAGSDQTVDEDTMVTFDGSGSTDNVGIASYTWTFVDVTPQTLTGVSPTYTFQTPGIYTVTLNVTDARGNWDTDQVIITVLDVTNPGADAGPDQTVDEDTLVTLEGWRSTDNVGVTSWTWTFTDVTPQTLTGENVTYTFTTPGIYTVTLEVSDAAGNHATDTVTITVLSLNPEECIQRLIETIESWNLGMGTENSLTSKLEDVLHLLDIGNENGAIHKLMDFINQVEALRGMKLTIEQADYLTAEAQRIIDLI